LIDGGYASEKFRKMEAGEKISFRGPMGGLRFDESNKNHFFVCTGTGITPFYSIFKEFVASNPDHQFTLLFGTRLEKDIVLRSEFEQMAAEFDNFTYLITLTREDWSGLRGRVQEHLPESVAETSFYICGLKDMVLDTRQKLLDQDVEPEHIKIERYT
jgi:ferredoxin-NADP reductase